MERDISFHLLHHLMNMAIEYRDRAEPLQVPQRLLAVRGAPAPIGIKRPQRNMREENDGRAGGARLQVLLQPLQLVVAKLAQPFLGSDIYESYEVDTLLIKAVPASALCAFAVALQILLAIVTGRVVLAGHIEDLLRLCALQYPVHSVKLRRLRQVAQVAGVDDEFGLDHKRVDFLDSRLQRAIYIRIGWFVEADMAVADLNEA